MIELKICAECGQLLTNLATAVRRHESDVTITIESNLEGYLTEKGRQTLAPEIADSLRAMRSAWDAYSRHRERHGLLKPAAKVRSAG